MIRAIFILTFQLILRRNKINALPSLSRAQFFTPERQRYMPVKYLILGPFKESITLRAVLLLTFPSMTAHKSGSFKKQIARLVATFEKCSVCTIYVPEHTKTALTRSGITSYRNKQECAQYTFVPRRLNRAFLYGTF